MTVDVDEHAGRRTGHAYRYYDLIMAAFVTVTLCSNFISAGKVARIGSFEFGAGVVFFPLSYVFGDVLTEVYGYARSRKVIWAGFGALAFASIMSAIVVALPPGLKWLPRQEHWQAVFGNAPRIAAASFIAFFVGEFANSYTLAKLKLRTKGRFLWVRTIGSTIAGEAFDSLIFYPLAFLGVWPNEQVVRILLTNYVLKVVNEVILTPLTYKVVGFLKRAEHEDYFDYDTDFTPFSLKT